MPPIAEHSHGTTAIAGAAFCDNPHFPREYQGNLFVGNVMTGRVHRLRTIYLPTIQHTGTWTMIRCLETSRDISGVYE